MDPITFKILMDTLKKHGVIIHSLTHTYLLTYLPMLTHMFICLDAIAKQAQYCDRYQTQYVEAPLLLKALLDEGKAGLTQRILFKAGADCAVMERSLEDYLKQQPKISGYYPLVRLNDND